MKAKSNWTVQYEWNGEMWATVVAAESVERAEAWFRRQYPHVKFIDAFGDELQEVLPLTTG